MKKYVIIIGLIGSTVLGYAQKSDGLSPDQAYDKVAKVLEKDLENHKIDLKNQFEATRLKFKADMEAGMSEVRDQSSMIRLLFLILGGLTVVGWIGSWWGLYRFTQNKLQSAVNTIVAKDYPKQVEKELRKLVSKGSQNLVELIQERSFENEVRREMSFCVVCQDKDELSKASSLLENIFGFRKAKLVLWDDFEGTAKEDLIVYYDFNGEMVNEHKTDMLEQLADAVQHYQDKIYILAYQGWLNELKDYREVANAANSPYTLYSRMMESLTYLYLKKRKQSGLHS